MIQKLFNQPCKHFPFSEINTTTDLLHCKISEEWQHETLHLCTSQLDLEQPYGLSSCSSLKNKEVTLAAMLRKFFEEWIILAGLWPSWPPDLSHPDFLPLGIYEPESV